MNQPVIISAVREHPDARYDPKFLSRPPTRAHFEAFYTASLQEIDRLRTHPKRPQPQLTDPHRVLFGHTHRPIPLSRDVPLDVGGSPIRSRRRFCERGPTAWKRGPGSAQ